MSHMRPCSYCGHGRFLALPELAVQLHRPKKILGGMGYQPAGAHLRFTLVACTSCGRTELFTGNVQELQNLPGASLVAAAST